MVRCSNVKSIVLCLARGESIKMLDPNLFLDQDTMNEITREVGFVAHQMPTVFIVRGPSSTGKTFLVNYLMEIMPPIITSVKIEADDYFWKNGVYNYQPGQVGLNHNRAQERCRMHMVQEETRLIIISNTSCTINEMQPYRNMAVEMGYMVMTLDLFADMRAKLNGILEPRIQPNVQWRAQLDAYVDHLVAVNVGVHNVSRAVILAQIERYEFMPWTVTLQQGTKEFGWPHEMQFSWGNYLGEWKFLEFFQQWM